MPRTARASVGGMCSHVLNRGNGRQVVFHKDGDYQAFVKAIAHACIEVPMRVLGYCLLPNHFLRVVWPQQDGDLSRWMHGPLNTQVRRYHRHYHSSGPIWQGRFKDFPVEADEHVLTVLRYVESNPVRANLVRAAQQWPWSSARPVHEDPARPSLLVPGPVPRPPNGLAWVNEPLTAAERAALRTCVNRGAPFAAPFGCTRRRSGWAYKPPCALATVREK